MTSQEYRPIITLCQCVPRVINPTLKNSIINALFGKDGSIDKREFSFLDRGICRINKLLVLSEPQRHNDLINIYNKEHPLPALPMLFSWESSDDLYKWQRTLLRTIHTFNEEISDKDHPDRNYKDPSKINRGNPNDVFRFYLWDFYARWVAKMITSGQSISTTEEQNVSNIVCNALCEAAVVEAEEQVQEMKGVVKWLYGQKWYDTKYGFSNGLVARAKAQAFGR